MTLALQMHRHYQHPLVRLGNAWLDTWQGLRRRDGRIDVQEMQALAMKRTGLSDFGPPSHREALQRLVDAINDEAGLHPFGLWLARIYLVDTLINRLLTAQFQKDEPACRSAAIRRPLFILGLPRTGSTMLHHLLAADPRHRWPSHQEVSMPAPPARGHGRPAGNPRLVSVERSWRGLHRFAPDLMRKHPTAPHAPDECYPLFANSFSSPMAEYQWHIPSYGDWLFADGLREPYAYFAAQLRVLQWRRPGERWLLKSPMHMAYLDSLFAEFPDACIVHLHRDPREVLGSACSLALTLRGLAAREEDRTRLGDHMLRKLLRESARCIEARRRLPSAQFIDIDYAQLMKEPFAAVKAIYDHFGFELDRPTLEAMQSHHHQHPKDRHGSHDYSASDFGLDEDRVRDAFADYLAFRPSVLVNLPSAEF